MPLADLEGKDDSSLSTSWKPTPGCLIIHTIQNLLLFAKQLFFTYNTKSIEKQKAN